MEVKVKRERFGERGRISSLLENSRTRTSKGVTLVNLLRRKGSGVE